MLRSAELSKPGTLITLLFSEPDRSLAQLLEGVEAEIARFSQLPSEGPRHLYVELPPGLLHEDLELEEWLLKHPSWNASFAGVISEEAHWLNAHYRGLYEEFARSAGSTIILGRSQDGRGELPQWVERRMIDFGKHVEVFEDDLWPRALLSVDEERRAAAALSEYSEEYEELQLPIVFQDTPKMELLLRQMLQGGFGALWGAEVLRPVGPVAGDECELRGLTVSPRSVFEWRSKVRARCVGLSDQISLLNVVGVGLERHNLVQSLRALQLLVDS